MHSIQIDPSVMSNDELAACTNEFVKRSINTLRASGYTQGMAVNIVATTYNDADYEIKHQARLGSEYGGGITRETNNLVLSAERAAYSWMQDQADKPEEVRKLIQGPDLTQDNDEIPY